MSILGVMRVGERCTHHPLGPLLVHDTVTALSASDRLSWSDLVCRRAVCKWSEASRRSANRPVVCVTRHAAWTPRRYPCFIRKKLTVFSPRLEILSNFFTAKACFGERCGDAHSVLTSTDVLHDRRPRSERSYAARGASSCLVAHRVDLLLSKLCQCVRKRMEAQRKVLSRGGPTGCDDEDMSVKWRWRL